MPNDSSGSIDDLLKGKREQAPVEPAPTPEAAPVPEPEPPAPEAPPPEPKPERPETLAEDIIGNKEKESKMEGEGPKSQPATAMDDSTTATKSAAPTVTDADLKNIKNLPQEDQVKMLSEMVMTDGLEKAIAVIKRLQNPYLYDLLHDTLVDELYQKLKGPKLDK